MSTMNRMDREGRARPLSGPERRVTPRVAARYPVKLICSGMAGSLSARSSDIGPHGIGVETSTPFALDSLQRVIIELPEGPLQATAEGRWQNENAAKDGHLTGIQLVDLDTETSSRLTGLVHQRAGELAAFLRDGTDLDLEMDEALDLALFTRVVEFGPGHHIHLQDQQGDRGDSVMLIRSGWVLLEARYRDSRPIQVERLGAGALFGGLPVVARVAHVASAITEGEVVALEIDSRTFEHFETTKPSVAKRIIEALMRRQALQLKALVEAAIRFRQAA